MAEERLHKIMAAAGVASRRACEQLILAGKVKVNGQTVTELGVKVDPALTHISVDGKPLRRHQRHVYLKLHKPRGVLGDIGDDPEDRQSVSDLLPNELRRVFPVGRLDYNSEGLILLTDDGDLAHQLTHPRFQHPKTYYVLVAEQPGESALMHFRRGIDLPEGRTAPASIRVVHRLPAGIQLSVGLTRGVWLEVLLREGKKRQIRHMTAAIGHPTLRLVRWAIGPLTLGNLKPGVTAPLTRREVGDLREMVRDHGDR
jgi:pseudouridine synthase